MKVRKIVVAITGASGSIYARLLVERLMKVEMLEEIAIIFSHNGREVAEYENQNIPTSSDDSRIRLFDNNDMFSAPASGSADYNAMVVVPCSMGTIGRVAGGVSGDLIARAADVMLKERRCLIMVARETPLSTIHLRNMTTISECGGVILPASPSFYSHPQSVEQVCMTIVERIMSLLGIDAERYKWGEQE